MPEFIVLLNYRFAGSFRLIHEPVTVSRKYCELFAMNCYTEGGEKEERKIDSQARLKKRKLEI